MTAIGPAAYAIYSCDVALRDVVRTLNGAGFVNEDICMVLSPSHPVAALLRETKMHNSGRNDKLLGTISWVTGFGAVVIPTVGFFARSQAYLHALMREEGSSALCEHSQTLHGLGFSEAAARRLSKQLGELGALVYIACDESAKADWAMELLHQAGGRDVAALEWGQAAAVA